MRAPPRYFRRWSLHPAIWVQDADTYILLGRWASLYNTKTREWYVVTNRPSSPDALAGGRVISEISQEEFRRLVPRARLAIFEDRVGFRPLGRILDWWARRRKKPGEDPPFRPAKIEGMETQG